MDAGSLFGASFPKWTARAKVEADSNTMTLQRKVIKNRPTLAVDTCFEGTTPVDALKCDSVYRTFTDTRVAAGEPTASDIMKCQLKPPNRADYGIAFFEAQWSTLQSTFPGGVCDYSRSGVDQVTPEPWHTFANGPGGRPLGPPPASIQAR